MEGSDASMTVDEGGGLGGTVRTYRPASLPSPHPRGSVPGGHFQTARRQTERILAVVPIQQKNTQINVDVVLVDPSWSG